MKKIFTTLKFIGAYLLITLATAVGVVFLVPVANTNANIGNGNSSNINQIATESNFTKIVNNLMQLRNFSVDAKVSLETEQETINLDMFAALHAGAGFSTIAANGELKINYQGNDYSLNILFIDNQLYLSINNVKVPIVDNNFTVSQYNAQDLKYTITTDSLTQAIGKILNLLNVDIAMPDMFNNFDMSMIATLLEDYTEEETTNGYDVSIVVMGKKINLTTDKDLNIKTVNIPTIDIGGLKIKANLELQTYDHDIEITHPQDAQAYQDLAKITNLVDFAKELLQNKYISFDITANIKNFEFSASIEVNFDNGLVIKVNSNSLGDPLNIFYNNGDVYFHFGSIKINANIKDFENVLEYIKTELPNKFGKLQLDQLDAILSTISTTISSLQKTKLPTVNIDDILGFVGMVSINGNNLNISAGEANAKVVISNNRVKSIIANYQDMALAIIVDSVQSQPIVFNTKGYTKLDDITPTLKAIINTLSAGGINGDLNITFGETTYSANIKASYVDNNLKLNISTVILNKDIQIDIQNNTLYIKIDQTKIKIPFDQAQELLNTLSSIFGFDLDLEIPTIPEFGLKDIAITQLITKLVADGSSLTVEGKDYSITLSNRNNYINHIDCSVSGLDLDFTTLKCGNVSIEDIADNTYTHYQEFITYVENIKNIVTNQQLSITLNTQVKYQSKIVNLVILADINTVDFAIDTTIYATIDGTTYNINATYVDGTLYLNYKDLRIKANSDIFYTLNTIIDSVLPKYIDMSQVDTLLNSLQIPTIPDLEINLNAGQVLAMVEQYSNVLRRFSFEDQTLSLALDLRSIIDINQIVYLQLNADSNKVSLSIEPFELSQMGITFNLEVKPSTKTIADPYNAKDYKDLNSYLKLIEVLDNTISSKYFDLSLDAIFGNYQISADAILDLTQGINVALSTDSLGSDLDIKFMQQANNKENVFFVTFGGLKLNCSISQLNKLYDLLTLTILPEVGGLEVKELEPLLNKIGKVVDKLDVILGKDKTTQTLLTQSQPQQFDLTQSIDEFIAIFNCLTVTDQQITFAYDNFNIVIDIKDNLFDNINITTQDFKLNIKLNSNVYVDNFSFDANEYVEFYNIYTKLDALVSTLITRQISGNVQVQVLNGDYLGTYTLDYVLSYANNQVYFDLSTTIFDQYVHVVYQNGTLYLTIDEFNLKASWDERFAITDYINNRFGTNFTFPSLKLEDLFKQDNKKPLDLKDINLTILTSLKATEDNLQLVVDNITINVNNQGTVVTDIQVTDGTTFALDFNIEKYGSQVELVNPKDTDYCHYTTLTNYIDEIATLVDSSRDEETDQYSIKGSAYLYTTNFKGVPELVTYEDGHQEYKDYVKISLDNLNLDITENLLDQLAIDLSVTGRGNLYKNSIGGLDAEFAAYFNSNNTNGGLYLNYNKLKAYLEKSALADIITSAKELVPMFIGSDLNAILDMIKFNQNNDIYVELSNIPDISKNINILEMIETYIPMLTTLKLDASGVLTIGIDPTNFTDIIKEPIVLKIYTDAKNNLHLACDGLFIGGDATKGYQGISFDLVVDTIDPFVGTPKDNTTYMDLSRADELLKTLTNTLRDRKEYHLESQVNLSIASILNWYIDVVVDIKIIDNKPVLAITIGEIPAVVGVDNDVPFETGDTESGSDRTLNIYYKDNYIYFYRTEYVNQYFGISKRRYEKCLKVTLDEFMADPLGLLLQYGFGFKDLVMNPIREAIAKSQANTDPLDYSNILLGFTHTHYQDSDTQSFELDLNLKEISKNDDLKNLQVTLFTTKQNNVEYLTDIDVYMDMDVGISIILQTKDENQNLTPFKLNLNGGCNIEPALTFINNYAYAPGEEWHIRNGKWQQDSGDYSVIFNTDYDGYTIDSVTAHVGTTITLPKITVDKVVVNGNDKDTYKFVGWCANSSLKGTIYNGEYTIPRGGANLYAVWQNVESIRSINYHIEGNLVWTQSGVVGTALNYPYNVADIEVVENGEKVLKIFDGWIDANGIRVQSIEAESQDVYATYKTIHTWRTITYKSNLQGLVDPQAYSNYDSYIVDLYDFGGQDQQVNSDGTTTTYRFDGWYYDAEYTTVCNITNMPDQNITLYAKWIWISSVSERNITIYDNDTAVYNKNLISGTALDINAIAQEDSDVIYNANTKWYLDAEFTQETTFPTVMPNDSDIVLYIRNRYSIDITYYVKEVVDGLDAHVEKHYTANLYQGQTIEYPEQTDYEITYYTNSTKSVPTKMVAYVFDGYTYNSATAPTTMDNCDMKITTTVTETSRNYHTITFVSQWKRPGGWITDGKNAQESNMHHGVEYALYGSTLQGTTLTRVTSILNNTTETETIKVSMSRTYGGPRYNFESACWNTTGCKMLYYWGSNQSASNELITIDSNKTVYAEWKNV